MLGWWKSSLNEPETIVPEVRTALGAWFRGQPTHDIRDLYAMITSSLLYTRTELVDPAASGAVDGVAPWLSGPTIYFAQRSLYEGWGGFYGGSPAPAFRGLADADSVFQQISAARAGATR